MSVDGFSYHERSDWPPLAWIASWRSGEKRVTIEHGRRVEVSPAWFGEIVWNGPYQDANFDRTDIVYGSGGKRREDGSLIFISSATIVDRLQYLEKDGRYWISNSLACLMAKTSARVDAFYPNYFEDFKSVIDGLEKYKRSLATTAGEIQLVYFDNVVWKNCGFRLAKKPVERRQRRSFEEYSEFLHNELSKVAENSMSPERSHRWSLMGTISTGFDSTTVSALGRAAGLEYVMAIDRAREGPSDSGDQIAKQLGLQVDIFERDGWKQRPLQEVPFLASDAKGEDVYFSSAASQLKNRVLLTGFCGSIWGGYSEAYIRLERADQSGLSLTEYRLWAGFINLPVPSMGVYGANDLLALMASGEATRWSSGKDYDKPFCRSVLTKAGVSDELYGVDNKAASVLIHDRDSFLSEASLRDFRDYWESQLHASTGWRALLRASSAASRANRALTWGLMSLARTFERIIPFRIVSRFAHSIRLSEYAHGEPDFKHLFPWAIEHAKRRYSDPSREQT